MGSQPTPFRKTLSSIRANTENPLKFLRKTMHGRGSAPAADAKLPGAGIVCLSVKVYRRNHDCRRRTERDLELRHKLFAFSSSQQPRNYVAIGPGLALHLPDPHRSVTGNGKRHGTFEVGYLSILDFYRRRQQILGPLGGEYGPRL